MELVIDANIIFSALIKKSHTRHLLLMSRHKFYAPEFLFKEIKKHFNILEEKTGLSKEKLNELIDKFILKSNICIIPFAEFKTFLKKAEAISPDPDDTPYFALALKLGCAILSNDKKLKEQQQIKIFSIEDFTELM